MIRKKNHLRPLQVVEKAEIIKVLKKYRWHKTRVSIYLEITRTTLWRKLKKYSIETPVRKKRIEETEEELVFLGSEEKEKEQGNHGQ